ncbi:MULTISPECIES: 5-(carboxyamino)imidazole ribonucleotide synthase [unclassified Pseudovibrio]|uniref:5-(carboxyamino)imidazole ribonucleotide synthase n=1 Tax=unclassified Pseudovibrio TaxID=2627060 RepID=UPI0007AE8814|nr:MULTISPECIES: 5-(carboxyamino)imidazole ribonucleotide synthase [unclassified Pseudovibrio]KZL13823.1 N5-carboxyaminoimidazole ribonucleotide synthase [Pseudovibrio sp. Ad37]KZL23366.1 N5-carboxyaminoimidazole ribonucleotide synthase [Pseudovibrio sp. WM33]
MGSTLRPGDTIGILGGGQLGRMIAQAASRMGLKCHIYCPDENSPAFEVSEKKTVAAYEDEQALTQFAKSVSVVTYEFENVPGETARILEQFVPVRPGPHALKVSQDRLAEKTFLSEEAATQVAPFIKVDTQAELEAALMELGGQGVLKTRRFGYDGKGQIMIRTPEDIEGAMSKLGNQPSILEGIVPFEKEISIIVARGVDGTVKCYDPADNYHKNHILKTSSVPADIPAETAQEAIDMATRIAVALDYIGVMGVELFVVRDGEATELKVNEIAPRVHNSGHWTEDACPVSQFEQHVRAVAGWPLGRPTRAHNVIMENLIGDDVNSWESALLEPNARLTLYGKAETREGRKMGHINRLSPKS